MHPASISRDSNVHLLITLLSVQGHCLQTAVKYPPADMNRLTQHKSVQHSWNKTHKETVGWAAERQGRKPACSGVNTIIHMCLEQTPSGYCTALLQRPTSHHSSAKRRPLTAQTLEITLDVEESQRAVGIIFHPPPSLHKSSIWKSIPILWKSK